MANCAVIGTQWGDEGKGKIIDLITPAFDIIARYQGGHNAGHTVHIKEKKIILHLIPSGILHPGKLCLIGNGVVFSPQAFLEEIAELNKAGFEVNDNLVVSKGAHLILPYHSAVEKVSEDIRGKDKIGTTCRGIGPAYVDKAARQGIKVGDLLNPSLLREKIKYNVDEKNIILDYYKQPRLDAEKIYAQFSEYGSIIEKYMGDVAFILHEKIKMGNSVLFEGAQGALLDIDHGTYPFVTSSNSTIGGVCTGLGIGIDKIDEVFGVTKAYTTRVGRGPFPTELTDEKGELLKTAGNEFGATTGRPRRCGWFDAMVVAYSCRLNGIKKIFLTKSDVLDNFDEIMIGTGYRYKGKKLQSFPMEPWIQAEIEPEYKTVKGWKTRLCDVKGYSRLPAAFLDYVKIIEDLLQVSVSIISTGVGRGDTILVEDGLTEIFDMEKIKSALVE
ncbi:MAG: adenylosuccinate synthase [Candidatus Aminicenantes bacterium]|nr:adenylosuccinate synthase [Candidatus Aminicenantes bacterium]